MDELRLLASDPPRSESELYEVALLPRPWLPAECEADLRRAIYGWLDEVVAWINEQCTWRTHGVVPHCWIEHPHLVHELAVVACLRWEAGYAFTPSATHEWHLHTLPALLLRLADHAGPGGCPPAKHQDAPGRSRHDLYRSAANVEARRRCVVADHEED